MLHPLYDRARAGLRKILPWRPPQGVTGRTSRRPGVRGQAEETHRPASGTAVCAVDTAVVVHSEGAGRQGDLDRSRGLTVSVDGVIELSAVEQGRPLGEHGHGHSNSGLSTVIGQK